MANNLVRQKKKDDGQNDTSDMIRKLDNISQPTSPEPGARDGAEGVIFSDVKKERQSNRKPFDLSNQQQALTRSRRR